MRSATAGLMPKVEVCRNHLRRVDQATIKCPKQDAPMTLNKKTREDQNEAASRVYCVRLEKG